MATFYIQLENKLLQISGDLTAENISKALGYVPVDSSTMNNYATKDEVKEIGDIAEENGILIAEVQEAINGIIAQVTSVVEKLNEEGGCAKSSGALAVSMLSAASLLVLVLRKKH